MPAIAAALVAAPFEIRPGAPSDAAAVEAVVARACGRGRYAKTGERLREGNALRSDLSFTAWCDGRLAGAVRLWTVMVGDRPVVFLGPIAVDADVRSGGLGAALVEAALSAVDAGGERSVLLVGDQAYFGRFGFERTRGVIMPGPVDLSRVLLRGDDVAGAVTVPRATMTAAADR